MDPWDGDAGFPMKACTCKVFVLCQLVGRAFAIRPTERSWRCLMSLGIVFIAQGKGNCNAREETPTLCKPNPPQWEGQTHGNS